MKKMEKAKSGTGIAITNEGYVGLKFWIRLKTLFFFFLLN